MLRRIPSNVGFSSYELALNREDGLQVKVMRHTKLHEDLYADVVKLSDRLGIPITNDKGDIIYTNTNSRSTDKLQHYVAPNILNTRERRHDKIIHALASLLIVLNIYSIWLNFSDNNPPHISETFNQSELIEWFTHYYQTEQANTEYPDNLFRVEKIVAAPDGKEGIELHVRYFYFSVNKNFTQCYHADHRYRVRINETGNPRRLFSVVEVGENGSANFLLANFKKLFEKWL